MFQEKQEALIENAFAKNYVNITINLVLTKHYNDLVEELMTNCIIQIAQLNSLLPKDSIIYRNIHCLGNRNIFERVVIEVLFE